MAAAAAAAIIARADQHRHVPIQLKLMVDVDPPFPMITMSVDPPFLVIASVVREVTVRGLGRAEEWMTTCAQTLVTRDSWFARTPAVRKVFFLLAQNSAAILHSKAVSASALGQTLALTVYAIFGIQTRWELILWRLLETVSWRQATEVSSLGRSKLLI